MINSQINLLIDSFGCWYTDGSKMLEPRKEIEYAAKVGYIIPESLCNISVHAYIESKNINYNSTFYKTWEEVTSKDRLELFIDQLIHYSSTYGTDFQARAYIPNENPLRVDWNTYKVIQEVTPDALIEKIMNLLSGIALDAAVVEACSQFLYEAYKKGYSIDIESIKNKETRCNLYIKLGIKPRTTDEFRRCIQNIISGNTMIVMGRKELTETRWRNLTTVQLNALQDLCSGLDEQFLMKLSSEFLRFRLWWLAIKKACKDSAQLKNFINNLRERSRKTHKPMPDDFWQNLTRHSLEFIGENLEKEVEKLDNPFKIIKLIEMIKLRKIQSQTHTSRIFKIRNGKSYMREQTPRHTLTFDERYDTIAQALVDKLVVLISRKREKDYGEFMHPTIKFPDGLEFCAPSSAKTFVGNIPFGSKFKLADKDAIIGIYWRNEWGTHDFDLSLIDKFGRKIGWNGGYYDEHEEPSIVFSGDMTDADPEAVELLYIKKDCPESTVQVNRFRGDVNSKYRLFFAKEPIKNVYKNYMVNPNHIQLEVDVISDSRQQIISYVKDGYVWFMRFSESDSIASYNIEKKVESWGDICAAHIPLKELLLYAGYREWIPNKEDPDEVPDIDLSNPTKDAIINLL